MRPWLENIEPFNEAPLLPLLIGDEEAGYLTEEEFTAAKAKIAGIGVF
jgi:hypothetical protein